MRVKTSAPVTLSIEVNRADDKLCDYDCPQWDKKDLVGQRDKGGFTKVIAFCPFGRLRWKQDDDTYRHKNCLASKPVRERKKK